MAGPIQETETVVIDIAEGSVLIVEDFVWSFLDYGIWGSVALGVFILAVIYLWRRK